MRYGTFFVSLCVISDDFFIEWFFVILVLIGNPLVARYGDFSYICITSYFIQCTIT